MKLIVGLGNPTLQYEHTRHNAGFDALDIISRKYDIPLKEKKHKGLYGIGFVEGMKTILCKPQTYMNLSGECVGELMDYYDIDPETELIVLSDDIDLPIGKIRVRSKGSAGGHNGLKNIIFMTGTDGFARVKIGVGEKTKGWDLADHVLSRFSDEDRKLFDLALTDAADAAVMILKDGAEAAMNSFNGKVLPDNAG